MDIRKLQKIVVSALEDIKGKDIQVINTAKVSSMFDCVVIATGDSNRQVRRWPATSPKKPAKPAAN
jgi:ribosome-associated protein